MSLDEALRQLVREELERQLAPIRERLERPRGALRPDEAAEYLGCSETTVRDLIRRGELAAVQLGTRATRLTIVELDRWLSEHSRRRKGVA